VNPQILRDLPNTNARLENAAPEEILKWVWDLFGDDMIASSSFQTQSVPLLHMISKAVPKLKIVFVDTGFHFPETLAFRDTLVARLDLNLLVVEPQIKGEEFSGLYGPLYAQSADACCFYNKIVPFQLTLENYSAWISGIRRDQTDNRRNTPIVGQHPFLPVVKISPLVNWTAEEVEAYIDLHDLPRHPLYTQGYRSIGCKPCTLPTHAQEDARRGRWPDLVKNECGMHLNK
jgi:phosphoadenosine phosphosulfate reductase